jgi:hypothetical protein
MSPAPQPGQYRQLGAGYSKLNSYVKIKPSEFRLITDKVTEDGLSYNGETIPMEPGNTPERARAVEALRAEQAPEPPPPADPVEQAFAKAKRPPKPRSPNSLASRP